MSPAPFHLHWPETGDLLLPKLSPPHPTAHLVMRERLLEQMDQALVSHLTLLSASAGFGKTTLLSSWATHCPVPVAWLSLEAQDNDPQRFWSYVFTALRPIEPQGGEIALTMLQSPQSPALTAILTALINRLALAEQPLVLVLDDMHVIEHPAILDSFQFFLEHIPAHVHLVLAGRTEPHLSLSRLRARGQVFELHQADLCFTFKETTAFLTRTMGISLTDEEIACLEQRAEGWIAGLQLAALASRARGNFSAFLRQLSGSQRYILEYLQEEVLEQQPADWQAFLLHTSILERLNASLCQAVTQGESAQASQQILEALEQANLFLVPLDEEQQWYRFHSLFRDVLQARVQVISPELVPTLHQRAARWYAQHGYIFEAVEHALSGRDFRFAAELLERTAKQMWSNGEAERLYGWLQRLPDAEILTHGSLMLTATLQLLYQAFYVPDEQWTLMVHRAEATMASIIRMLENQPATALPEAEKQVLHQRVRLLRAWIAIRAAYLAGNEEEMHALGEQAQELARDENMVWKMIPTYVSTTFPPPNWPSILSELRRQAEQEGNIYEAIWMNSLLSEFYELNGKLHAFHQVCLENLHYLKQSGKARARFGYTHLHLATAYRAWNQRTQEHAHLQTALEFARMWQHVDIQLKASAYVLQAFLADGQLEQAEQFLAEMEPLVRQSSWGHHRSILTTSQAGIWLAQGKLTEVAAWAAHTSFDLSRREIDEQGVLTLVQVYLALQRYIDALRMLDDLLAWSERHQQIFWRIHFLALQVVALHTSGEILRAREGALHLLSLTEPEGYVRVYLDAGQPMRDVLQSLLDNPQDAPDEDDPLPTLPVSYLTSLLATFEQEKARRTNQSEQDVSASATSILLEPLTPREMEVLHLIALGATNQVIAERLVISLATAKKHVTNLLGKLEARNRAQAITRARESSLL